jgi:hypothetical protein
MSTKMSQRAASSTAGTAGKAGKADKVTSPRRGLAIGPFLWQAGIGLLIATLLLLLLLVAGSEDRGFIYIDF